MYLMQLKLNTAMECQFIYRMPLKGQYLIIQLSYRASIL